MHAMLSRACTWNGVPLGSASGDVRGPIARDVRAMGPLVRFRIARWPLNSSEGEVIFSLPVKSTSASLDPWSQQAAEWRR